MPRVYPAQGFLSNYFTPTFVKRTMEKKKKQITLKRLDYTPLVE